MATASPTPSLASPTAARRPAWMTATPLAVCLAAGACLDVEGERAPLPLDTGALGLTAGASLRDLGAAWSDAADWLGDDDLMGWLADLTDRGPAASVEPAPPGPVPGSADPVEPAGSTTGGPRELLERLGDRLERDLLVPANLEDSDGLTATYLLPAAALCGLDPAAPPATDGAEAACLGRFEAVPLRLRVVSYAAGSLDLTLLVGAVRLEPVTAELRAGRLAATLDVGEAFAALALYGAESGDPHDHLALRAASGAVRVAFERRGPRAARATLEVVRPLTFDAALDGQALVGSLGASRATLDLDGDARRATLDSAIGSLLATAPLQLLADALAQRDAGDSEPAPVVTGALALDLAGATARVTVASGTRTIAIEGLGLGGRRSTLRLGDALVAGVDLNAGVGRRLDLTLTGGAADLGRTLSVSPELDLVVNLGLRHLAGIDAELATGWAADETVGLAADGDPSPSVRIGDAVQVLRGRLALVSRAHPALSLEVTAGECLLADDADSAQHPLERLSAGVCPAE